MFCIVLLRKNFWKIWAILTCVPFLVGLYGSLTMLEHHARFYLNTLPAVAMLIAVSWGLIGLKRSHPIYSATAVLLWLIIALGIVPSILSPSQSWQHRFSASDPLYPNLMRRYYSGEMAQKSDLRHCYRALKELDLDKSPHRVTIFDP